LKTLLPFPFFLTDDEELKHSFFCFKMSTLPLSLTADPLPSLSHRTRTENPSLLRSRKDSLVVVAFFELSSPLLYRDVTVVGL